MYVWYRPFCFKVQSPGYESTLITNQIIQLLDQSAPSRKSERTNWKPEKKPTPSLNYWRKLQENMMASDMETDSVPQISDMDSPGSSVSSSLQREYEELLKYAVVTPKIQLASSIYGYSVSVKDTAASETSTSGSSTSSNTLASTKSSESTEESHSHAKEDVKQLPGTPSLKVSFQGQGSIARDSLLRSGRYSIWPWYNSVN